MFRCEFVPEDIPPPGDPLWGCPARVTYDSAGVLRDRLKRLDDMRQSHGDNGAILVLAALWVEAQHSARFSPDDEIPVRSYRVR